MRNGLRYFVPALLATLLAGVIVQWIRDGDSARRFAAVNVESSRPTPGMSLNGPADVNTGTGGDRTGDGKVASEAADRDLSLVATAVSSRVEVFAEPANNQALTVLRNPVPSGAPLVFLVDEHRGEWLKVLLPLRPNGSSGWVRARDVALARHHFRIEVRLAEFTLDVYANGKIIQTSPIGVARENTPTPGGRFYTTELLQPTDPNSAYGSYAYGLSGFSDVLTSFNGGPGQLGLHGTNDDSTIGTRVSSGCIRMHNSDLEKLVALLPLGVPVTITP